LLHASALPSTTLTLFLLGDSASSFPNVFGGSGMLCVSGSGGRFAPRARCRSSCGDRRGQLRLTEF